MNADAIREDLARHRPYRELAPEHLGALAAVAQVVAYRSGESILAPGGIPERFYIVRTGVVEAAPLPGRSEGEDFDWDLDPGDCFPIGALISGSTVSSAYTAGENTTCYAVPIAVFRTLLRESEIFQQFCLQRAAELLDRFRRVAGARSTRDAAGAPALAQPLGSVLRRAAITCPPGTPLGTVLERMQRERIGAMIVADADRRPLGVFTLHDVLDRVALPRAEHTAPIEAYMSRNLVTLPASATALEAALAMVRHGIRHVLVVDGDAVAGIVSENDLFSLQRLGMRELSAAIARSDAVDELAGYGREIMRLASDMLTQGMAAEQLTQFVASLNDVLTRRLIDVLLDPHVADVAYCWIALGSEGRHEQTLVTDQDNGIIFSPPAGADVAAVRARLLTHARTVNQALDQAGYALCKGNIMAGNPAWCLTLGEWQQRFGAWIGSGTPEALLDAAIFFDFRSLHGRTALADELQRWLHRRIARQPKFLHQMAANALRTRPPVGLLRDFLTDGSGAQRNTVDLKLNGASPFVDAARIYALQTGVGATNTAARLREVCARLQIADGEREAWIRAFLVIQLARLKHQQAARLAGGTPDNRINPYALNDMDRLTLREAFRQARKLQARLALDFQV